MNESNNDRKSIVEVAELLLACRDLLFVTGAGISADSGLPTYRGVGGLYDVDTTAEGVPIEEILSGEMLRKSPQLTWKYLLQIGEACRGATFNRGHEVLAEMEQHFDRVCVLTQNVDGFHTAAGSTNVIDLHGDLHELVCTQCEFHERIADQQPLVSPPFCPRCQAVLRPDVVLFGEMLQAAKTERLYRELREGFDIVFSIGTSSAFQYIAWPIQLAKDTGKSTVEINPLQPTSLIWLTSEYLRVPASRWMPFGLITRTGGRRWTPADRRDGVDRRQARSHLAATSLTEHRRSCCRATARSLSSSEPSKLDRWMMDSYRSRGAPCLTRQGREAAPLLGSNLYSFG